MRIENGDVEVDALLCLPVRHYVGNLLPLQSTFASYCGTQGNLGSNYAQSFVAVGAWGNLLERNLNATLRLKSHLITPHRDKKHMFLSFPPNPTKGQRRDDIAPKKKVANVNSQTVKNTNSKLTDLLMIAHHGEAP